MIEYARADAHYLLYIAYCLCLELKQLKNGMFSNCMNLCILLVNMSASLFEIADGKHRNGILCYAIII